MRIEVKNKVLTDIFGQEHILTDSDKIHVMGSTTEGHFITTVENKGQFIVIPDQVKKVIFESLWEIFTKWIKNLIKVQ